MPRIERIPVGMDPTQQPHTLPQPATGRIFVWAAGILILAAACLVGFLIVSNNRKLDAVPTATPTVTLTPQNTPTPTSAPAAYGGQSAPVEVTREVMVTQLVSSQIEVTKIVYSPGASIVKTQLVPVTQLVPGPPVVQTQIVYATQLVYATVIIFLTQPPQTPTMTASAFYSPTPTNTATASPTASQTPTQTATASETPTPTPTETPTP